jgi:UDP-glucose:(heptosyl)LPS alpha-1,3-glucosyltransferase
MNIAFCYENVMPARGGCETYIADLGRRLIADGHDVHLYACRWDEAALPARMHVHRLAPVTGLRFLKPWRFGRACLDAMRGQNHDVTLGFDKTWGQDVLYPQGGLHVASVDYNRKKHASPFMRGLAWLAKCFDLAHVSFTLLERKQYLSAVKPQIIVNSFMVRDHFQHYYAVSARDLHVIRSAIDPGRFPEHDRPKLRQEMREKWNVAPGDVLALFAGMNYRLKGLDPLLRAVRTLIEHPDFRAPAESFRLVVAGNPNYRRYEVLARRLGIDRHVRFLGHCAPMRHAYFAADFLVHPTFYDPCSLVVLEALACGLPVITTRANGASELLSPPREGYVIDDPHDREQLAWCMGKLLDGPQRHACSQAARNAGWQWTFDAHYQQLMQVFQDVSRRKQAA